MLKVVGMEPFLFLKSNIDLLLFFSFSGLWEATCQKTVENLVVYEDLWEPESQKNDLGSF